MEQTLMFNDKLLKISLGFIALLIILGFIAINYMLKDTVATSSYTDTPVAKKANNVSTDAREVSLDTIFINIRSSKFKILKADIALEMKSNHGQKALINNMNNVRNAILQYLNTMNSDGLETLAGKEQLKKDLITMLEETFGYE